MLSEKLNKKPFFSIAIPTKDRSELLYDLIDSILHQDFENYQIIIADNSVDEDSLEIVEKINSNKINYIRTGGLKMYENWNACIDESNGRYLILLSDKTLLKRGALSLLYRTLKNKNHGCITWDLDQIIDKTLYISKLPIEDSYNIKSSDLLKKMLGSDWIGFDFSPMHSNSCISINLINEIKGKFGSLCMELNPDYIMATHILLSIESIYRINNNLTILQRPSLVISYGNGSSFLKKTPLAKGFMKDHISWENNKYRERDIPIKGNSFVLNIMLKDVYAILKSHKIDPSIYLEQEERIENYYYYTFKEILWRKSMGINMKDEIELWNEAFYKEKHKIKQIITERVNSLLVDRILSNIKYFIKNNIVFSKILGAYREIKYKNIGIKYSSTTDCLSNNTV